MRSNICPRCKRRSTKRSEAIGPARFNVGERKNLPSSLANAGVHKHRYRCGVISVRGASAAQQKGRRLSVRQDLMLVNEKTFRRPWRMQGSTSTDTDAE